MNKDKLIEALKILQSENNLFENNSKKEKVRLNSIIEKLSRLIQNQLNHSEDLSPEEINEMEIMRNYIRGKWGNCKNLRSKIDNEGPGYFYNSYTYVPVSYETYMNFFDDRECWCEKC